MMRRTTFSGICCFLLGSGVTVILIAPILVLSPGVTNSVSHALSVVSFTAKRLTASALGYPELCRRCRMVSAAASIAKRSNLPPARIDRSRMVPRPSGIESNPLTTKDLNIIGGPSLILNLTRAARLRLAAGREAARERSVSPSPARCGRPKFSSAASLVREKARSVEREACAGLRVAQRKTRPNRRRRRHQWLAADPWRQDGGDNSILRSREAYFGVRESSRISPLHVNGQSTPCGDSFSSYYPRFSAVVAVVNLQLLNARLS